VGTLSLYDRYLLYLSCILMLPRRKISRILLEQGRQVNRFQVALKEKMEEYYGQSRITS
jgi:hypothetical protein